jgi:hypothetical protein
LVIKLEPLLLSWLQPRKNNCVPTELDVSISAIVCYTVRYSSRGYYDNTACGVFKGSIKLERFLPKNKHSQRKLLNFENWVNGDVSKIGHHFRK